MKNNARFIQIAAALGIAVPTCLLGTIETSNVSEPKVPSDLINKIENPQDNPIHNKIITVYSEVEQTPAYKIAHTNVHANYTVPHTNVHSDYGTGNKHTDDHSNTRSRHADSHSNSKV